MVNCYSSLNRVRQNIWCYATASCDSAPAKEFNSNMGRLWYSTGQLSYVTPIHQRVSEFSLYVNAYFFSHDYYGFQYFFPLFIILENYA